jgi:predicted DNA binding CopG/RHH family protein
MKDHGYDEDEREVISDYESGILQSDPNLTGRKEELREAARSTQNKTRNINIRLTEKDLSRLKAKAAEEGIPYQTLVSSILHKAVATYHVENPAQGPAPYFIGDVFFKNQSTTIKTYEENHHE